MTTVAKTVTRLADGRELIYFDETAGSAPPPDRVAEPDQRPPSPGPGPSEMRYDHLLDEWVAIAAHRQTRTFLPPSDQCPLCPSTNGRLTEVPATAYDVVVFENRFPSFADGEGPHWPEAGTELPANVLEGAGRLLEGRGRCEVICFSSDHQASFGTLGLERARTVMTAWVDRVRELSARDSVRHVFPFENRGEEIGVTLHHPHGQIYGYPFVPPRIRQMLSSARAYAAGSRNAGARAGQEAGQEAGTGADGPNLFDDMLALELAGNRVVATTEHWVAFVPHAAHWPVEVHFYPRRRVPALDELSEEQQRDFAPLYLAVLRALDANFGQPVPYIAGWYQAPVDEGRDVFALHNRVVSARRAPGKLKYMAGSEAAMGAWINDVLPEQVAARLRELVRSDLTDAAGASGTTMRVPEETTTDGDPR